MQNGISGAAFCITVSWKLMWRNDSTIENLLFWKIIEKTASFCIVLYLNKFNIRTKLFKSHISNLVLLCICREIVYQNRLSLICFNKIHCLNKLNVFKIPQTWYNILCYQSLSHLKSKVFGTSILFYFVVYLYNINILTRPMPWRIPS